MTITTLFYSGNSVHGWFLLLPSAPGGPVRQRLRPTPWRILNGGLLNATLCGYSLPALPEQQTNKVG
jgi:hypothetical protein